MWELTYPGMASGEAAGSICLGRVRFPFGTVVVPAPGMGVQTVHPGRRPLWSRARWKEASEGADPFPLQVYAPKLGAADLENEGVLLGFAAQNVS